MVLGCAGHSSSAFCRVCVVGEGFAIRAGWEGMGARSASLSYGRWAVGGGGGRLVLDPCLSSGINMIYLFI